MRILSNLVTMPFSRKRLKSSSMISLVVLVVFMHAASAQNVALPTQAEQGRGGENDFSNADSSDDIYGDGPNSMFRYHGQEEPAIGTFYNKSNADEGSGQRRFNGGASNISENNSERNDGPALRDIDELIIGAMRQYHVPGAAVAVAYQGRLVYAKGYGVANIRTGDAATETTLFNLGSCTKAISMFGILRLCEQQKLNLDDRVYDVIGRPPLPENRIDPRVLQITVRQLLHHSGGWNDDSGFVKASREVKRIAPNGMPYREGVRILFMTPLDYAPGTNAKYANGQWNLIKYVVTCAAQMPYARFLKEQLASIGISDMRDETQGYTPGESARYTGNPPKVFPSGAEDVPLAPTFGNWMASAIDMAKFLTALDGSRISGITQNSYEQMIAPLPPPMVNDKDGNHFGLGMDYVRQTPKGVYFSKNGGKPGVHAQIVHLPIGADFVVLMNGGAQDDGSTFNPMPISKITRLLNSITAWPEHNLFQRYQ